MTYDMNWLAQPIKQSPCITATGRGNDTVPHAGWPSVQQQLNWGSQWQHDPGTDPENLTQQKIGQTPWAIKIFSLVKCIFMWLSIKAYVSDTSMVVIHVKESNKSPRNIWHTQDTPNTSWTMDRHQLLFEPRVSILQQGWQYSDSDWPSEKVAHFIPCTETMVAKYQNWNICGWDPFLFFNIYKCLRKNLHHPTSLNGRCSPSVSCLCTV